MNCKDNDEVSDYVQYLIDKGAGINVKSNDGVSD